MPVKGAFVPVEQRLWKHVRRGSPSECWEWTGSRDQTGYGLLKAEGNRLRTVRAHRVAWEVTFGSIPEGLWVLHHCDNPPCCNPAHLFLGTNDDNQADRIAKGRGPNHHGQRNPNARLTASDVEQIRELVAAGHTHRQVARQFGVNRSTVGYVVAGKRWRTQ